MLFLIIKLPPGLLVSLDSSFFAQLHLLSETSPLKSPTEAVDKAMSLVTKEDPPDAQVRRPKG